MIGAIKLQDGSKVDIAPNTNTFSILINSLGDEICFTLQETEEAKVLWEAFEDFKKDLSADDRPASAKPRSGKGIVFMAADGEPSEKIVKALRKQLRSAAPQYNSNITFLLKRYQSIKDQLKMVKTSGNHYVQFSFSIAKGCKAF